MAKRQLSASTSIYKSILMQLKQADTTLNKQEYVRLLDDVIKTLEIKRTKVNGNG